MLPLGSLCVHEEYLRRRITEVASLTMMGLWAITHSPLFIDGVLSSLDEREMALVKRRSVLALNASNDPPMSAIATQLHASGRQVSHRPLQPQR